MQHQMTRITQILNAKTQRRKDASKEKTQVPRNAKTRESATYENGDDYEDEGGGGVCRCMDPLHCYNPCKHWGF